MRAVWTVSRSRRPGMGQRLPPMSVRALSSHISRSSTLRTMTGAGAFCRHRSYLSTARKQGQSAFTALGKLHQNNPWISAVPATPANQLSSYERGFTTRFNVASSKQVRPRLTHQPVVGRRPSSMVSMTFSRPRIDQTAVRSPNFLCCVRVGLPSGAPTAGPSPPRRCPGTAGPRSLATVHPSGLHQVVVSLGPTPPT